MHDEKYELGWLDGYEAFQQGFESEFRTASLKDQTIVDVASKQPVAADVAEFARGYIDGWIRAAHDSWE
jgi:hypothetical protein